MRQGDTLPAGALRARMSEKQFQAEVERIAARCGWVSFHDRDSRRNDAGFPDLLLIRERIVWAELKSEHGKVSADQRRFLYGLLAAGQEVYIWRPADLDEIERVLA